jgi:hypothetical protein
MHARQPLGTQRALQRLRHLTPRHAAIAYFACFAAGWLGVAAAWLWAGAAPPPSPFRVSPAGAAAGPEWFFALAAHAAVIALLAWRGRRWLFAHGALAVAGAGLPLLLLLRELWLVPAFLYVIAVLHVWQAAQHESPGRLQAPRRRDHMFE